MATAATQQIPNNPLYGAAIKHNIAAFASDGAITLVGGGVAMLTKAGIGAYTLAVPTVDGSILYCVSTTANAHVITQATVGFNAKGSSGTITFGGAIGDSVTLVSYSGNWYVLSDNNITPG